MTNLKRNENTQFFVTPVPAQSENDALALFFSGWFGLSDQAIAGRNIGAGDRICLYVGGKGIVAKAAIAADPEREPAPGLRTGTRFTWRVRLAKMKPIDPPIPINTELRSQLDAFKGREPTLPWSWFVQSTKRVTSADYDLLTKAHR